MPYKKINVELILTADEANPVVAELNSSVDSLDEKHALFGGEIETALSLIWEDGKIGPRAHNRRGGVGRHCSPDCSRERLGCPPSSRLRNRPEKATTQLDALLEESSTAESTFKANCTGKLNLESAPHIQSGRPF